MVTTKRFALLIGVTLLACSCMSAFVVAQDDDAEMQVNLNAAKPMYTVLPGKLSADVPVPAASLQTWNGSFTYGGSNYTYNMVGTAPSTNSTTTVPVLHRAYKDRSQVPKKTIHL